MKKSRFLTAALLGLTLGFAHVPDTGVAESLRVVKRGTSSTLSVPMNRAVVVESDSPFAELSIANPQIADISSLSDRTIYVLGKSPGMTTLTLLDANGQLITNVDVRVAPDISEFKERLRQILPGETIEVDSFGQRDHSWGTRDWWTYSWSWMSGWLDDGTRFHGTSVHLDGLDLYGTGYIQVPARSATGAGDGDDPAWTVTGVDVVGHHETFGANGLPASGRWQVGELDLAVQPVAFAPVGIAGTDGRYSRFPRAWCRFETTDGRRGDGWVEWNYPS